MAAEDRLLTVVEYYGVSVSIIRRLLSLPQGQTREAACAAHGVHPWILRTMLEYNRNREASDLAANLLHFGARLDNIRALDFGCLVADYGMYLARRGARVSICDYDVFVNFAEYRFKRENLTVAVRTAPAPPGLAFANQDIVIFGEVLEHLEDPLNLLACCADLGTGFIYSSCYPFGDDDYFRLPGHKKQAQRQQLACISLLLRNYSCWPTYHRGSLWIRTAVLEHYTELACDRFDLTEVNARREQHEKAVRY